MLIVEEQEEITGLTKQSKRLLSKKIKIKCDWCEKHFYKKKYNSKFCSHICYQKSSLVRQNAEISKRTGKIKNSWKNDEFVCELEECDKTFHKNNFSQKFCCREHKWKHNSYKKTSTHKNKKWYDYETHKAFAINANFKTVQEWNECHKRGFMPVGIYFNPADYFDPVLKERKLKWYKKRLKATASYGSELASHRRRLRQKRNNNK